MSQFKKGDAVRLVNPESMPTEFGGVLTVDDVVAFLPRIGVEAGPDAEDSAFGRLGAFYPVELEHVALPPVVEEGTEVEEQAQPVTFRICVKDRIGNIEYPTFEAAQQAARESGDNGEQFSIWEVVKIAEYRVKVTKELEDI